MKITVTTNELLSILKEVSEKYNCYGLRTTYEPVQVGDKLDNSYQCFDGEEPYELPGTSCTGFGYLWFDGSDMDIKTVEKAIKQHKGYFGENTYIIAGDRSEYGNDDGEEIIADAVVVAIIGNEND